MHGDGLLILGLDTTTERLHLALRGGERTWTRWVGSTPGRSHSAFLLPTLDRLLAQAGAAPADLAGVAACVGPGGFTALRVGVATAEGLALTGLPTWGFSAFELRARALRLAGRAGAGLDRPGRPAPGGLPAAMGGRAPGPGPEAAPGWPGRRWWGMRAWWAPEPSGTGRRRPCPSRPWTWSRKRRPPWPGWPPCAGNCPWARPEAPLAPFYLRETDAEVHFPEASGHLSEALRRGTAR